MELAAARPATVDDLADLLVAAYPALVRRLALVLRDADAAQDVAQSAFARALEGRDGFHGGDARAWLHTIGLRLAFNEPRRRSRRTRATGQTEPTWALACDPDLWAALGQIDPRPRAALLMSVLDGHTHDEIGTILGVPAGTVSSWLSRTKERLRTTLGEA